MSRYIQVRESVELMTLMQDKFGTEFRQKYMLSFSFSCQDKRGNLLESGGSGTRSRQKKLRGVMPLDQIQELQDILKIRDIEPSNQTWDRRYREYMAKIATGEPLQIAEVLRDLALLKLKESLFW